jgi:hypothetical protein
MPHAHYHEVSWNTGILDRFQIFCDLIAYDIVVFFLS